jgi:branched-chain amino acid aminotransferase
MTRVQVFECLDETIKIKTTEVKDFSSAIEEFGPGAYTVFLIYPGRRILRFRHHYNRLQMSCSSMGIEFNWAQKDLMNMVKAVVSKTDIDNPRICLLMPKANSGNFYFIIEQFSPLPKKAYQNGVRVEYIVLQRKHPLIKDSSFISERKKIRKIKPDAHEILLCDADGFFLEGLSSNFYAVLDGEIYTAGEGVLSGISRSILLSVAKKELPVNLRPLHNSDIDIITEAFLTSTSRGVLPIRNIGSTRIGSKTPGDVTKRLQVLFNEQIEKELEPLD